MHFDRSSSYARRCDTAQVIHGIYTAQCEHMFTFFSVIEIAPM